MANSAVMKVLRGNTAFTNDLYQILSEKEGNIFFSPIGIHICLAMMYQGAQSITADVLSKILRLPDAESTAKEYKAIMKSLNSAQSVVLLMANKIYIAEHKNNPIEFLENFKTSITENFYADLELIDFDNIQEAVRVINAWVEEKTQNKIQNMVDEQFVEGTALLLINALYFKGQWGKKFDEGDTHDQKFYLDDDKTIEVKMMHNRSEYPIKSDEELEAKVLQLPYQGDNMSMIIILPHANNGIKNLESKLAAKNLSEVIQNLRIKNVHLSLPKFKIEQTMDLGDILKKMGLENIFNESKANFSSIMKMSGKENLYVGGVLQKSFIEVNEEGTEAAAATAVKKIFVKKAVRRRIEEFHVDHPAIFMLVAHHDTEMNILFYGRLASPEFSN